MLSVLNVYYGNMDVEISGKENLTKNERHASILSVYCTLEWFDFGKCHAMTCSPFLVESDERDEIEK